MRVADIMTQRPVTVGSRVSAAEAARLLDIHGFRCLPVLEKSEGPSAVVGLLTDSAVGRVPEGDAAVRVVSELMLQPPVCIGPELPADLAAWRMIETGLGALCVTDRSELVGIVTATNLIRAYSGVCRAEGLGGEPRVDRCMTRDIQVLAPEDSAEAAMSRCFDYGVRHLPVVEEGKLTGIVATRDLRRLVGRESPEGGCVATATRPLDEALSPRMRKLAPDAQLPAAADEMVRSNLSTLPIALGSELVGVLTQTDVVEYCATSGCLSELSLGSALL